MQNFRNVFLVLGIIFVVTSNIAIGTFAFAAGEDKSKAKGANRTRGYVAGHYSLEVDGVPKGKLNTLEPTSCNAVNLQHLIGQNRRVLNTLTFANPIRVEPIGQTSKVEADPNRVRIHVDTQDVIVHVFCG